MLSDLHQAQQESHRWQLAAKLLLGQVVGDARGIVKAQRKERQRRDRNEPKETFRLNRA